MSSPTSSLPPSECEITDDGSDDNQTEPTTAQTSQDEEEDGDRYNLKPPPPAHTPNADLEAVAKRFFSADHLDLIIRDSSSSGRFKQFLKHFKPQHIETLHQYARIRKAIVAIKYANAIFESIPLPADSPCGLSNLEERFEERFEMLLKLARHDLLEDALPAYLTHRLVSLVTDILVKRITGNSAPLHNLLPSLAEVYCISDASLPDNPICYASKEFFKTTQYGRSYSIGRNCRFLQGPESSNTAIQRLVKALANREESLETILNYRRDGSPFLNLLMIAPLHDDQGKIRYYIGCQIDVSALVEGGRGIDSFAKLLEQDRQREVEVQSEQWDSQQELAALKALIAEDEGEMTPTRASSRISKYSVAEDPPDDVPKLSFEHERNSRVILAADDRSSTTSLYQLQTSPRASGRLPGVYQNFLLLRPYPSLRITFTSSTLRIPGLVQSKFMDHIGGPKRIRHGLIEAFSRGTCVTAKITWLTTPTEQRGKSRWVHCTPLSGADSRVGVWMVVMVEDEQVTGTLSQRQSREAPIIEQSPPKDHTVPEYHQTLKRTSRSNKYASSGQLYAEYLKRESRERANRNKYASSGQLYAEYLKRESRLSSLKRISTVIDLREEQPVQERGREPFPDL